jgi:hypothetical protein
MENSAVVLTVFNEPYGTDMTNTRMIARGSANFANGTYVAGGFTPNKPPYLYESGDTVLLPTLNLLPDSLELYSGNGSGYIYALNTFTGNIQIFDAGSEFTGNVGDTIVNDDVTFVASWAKL